MNDDDLKAIFDNAPLPPPSVVVRRRIESEALVAFRQAQAEHAEKNIVKPQGMQPSPRLTDESQFINTEKRKPLMKQHAFTKRRWLSGLAASVALVIGLFTLERSNVDHATPAPSSSEDLLESTQTAPELQQADSESGQRALAEQAAAPAAQQPPMAVKAEPANRVAPARMRVANALAAPKLMADAISPPPPATDRDRFEPFADNPIQLTSASPVSTFSIDVDTASYSYVRRQLNAGRLPATDSVRIEEMINYFDYSYAPPSGRTPPFATHVNVVESPWKPGNKLVHIGIKGYQISKQEQPDSNLVLLLDVSGSMNSPDKLPLVKQSMGLLLESLKPDDTVAIVVYAGAAGAVLEPTPVAEKAKILAALEQLQAGGATAGGQGLALAYRLAELNYNKDGINRIILATDGDFNVGITRDERLEDFVARKRDSGIYLSVFGFGQGNYQDALMQKLAQNGNGVAAYIDTLSEAQKIMLKEATSALFPIANDVKIQVEFNPATVAEYRLIGYESRALAREDFHNDKVDAGDIGSGHTVTALYEITPTGSASRLVSESRYGKTQQPAAMDSGELGFLQLRYKQPGATESHLISAAILAPPAETAAHPALSDDIDFAVAVAGFGQLLKGGKYTADWTYDDAIALAQGAKGSDDYGYRSEFIQLVRKAKIATAI